MKTKYYNLHLMKVTGVVLLDMDTSFPNESLAYYLLLLSKTKVMVNFLLHRAGENYSCICLLLAAVLLYLQGTKACKKMIPSSLKAITVPLTLLPLYAYYAFSRHRFEEHFWLKSVLLLILFNYGHTLTGTLCLLAEIAYGCLYSGQMEGVVYVLSFGLFTFCIVKGKVELVSNATQEPESTVTEGTDSTCEEIVARIMYPMIYLVGCNEVISINPSATKLLEEYKMTNFHDFVAQTVVASNNKTLKEYVEELSLETPCTISDCEIVEDCVFKGIPPTPKSPNLAGTRFAAKLKVSIMRKIGEEGMVMMIKKKKSIQDEQSLKITDCRLRMMLIKTLSHDLRTPLNGIMNFMDRWDEQEDQQLARRIVKQNSKILQMKTEDMLDFAHILEGEFEIRKAPFDLCEFFAELKEIAISQNPNIATNIVLASSCLKLDISESAPKQVMADRSRLLRVLLHLVLNGYKYAPDGTVEISVRYNYMTQELEFSVNDAGAGISPRKLVALENFLHSNILPHELSSSSQELAQMGLGLYITAKICEKIGTPLRVYTLEGYGTSFSFKIKQPLRALTTRMLFAPNKTNIFSPQLNPCVFRKVSTFRRPEDRKCEEEKKNDECMSQSSASSLGEVGDEGTFLHQIVYRRPSEAEDRKVNILLETEPTQPLSAGRKTHSTFSTPNLCPADKRTVLVVDDNALNRFVLRGLLQKLGCIVEEANDGLQAFQKTQGRRFDAVFMDLNMPVMSGLTSTEQIRSYEQANSLRRIPIIAVTAFEGAEIVRSCYKKGMNEVLIKPITFDVIKGCVNKYIKNIRA